MFINHASKQVTAKIVYYGPGLSGKTTNLQYIFSVTNPKSRGELVSIETDIERTLFFDLLPMNVGLIKGYQTLFQLYTVPGQIFYDSTRKLVLKGADGVVFVADSQELMTQANEQSLENLKVNLAAHSQDINAIPMVFQYNKRDLNSVLPSSELNRILNPGSLPYFEAVAKSGNGVIETLREISTLTLGVIKSNIDAARSPFSDSSKSISFDTNHKKKILEIDKMPQRKISLDSIEHPDSSPPLEKAALSKSEKSADAPAREDKTLQSIKEMAARYLGDIEDNSRITILKKLSGVNSGFTVDVRGPDQKALNSFSVKLSPDTRKVTIVFDLKN